MSKINICIATYNRNDHLYRTITSLAAMDWAKLADHQVEICIFDNNPDGRARSVVAKAQEEFPERTLIYHHETRPGVAFVRNSALAYSQNADFLAFIDDDEYATHDWLAALLACQAETKAAACYGPVHSQYPDTTPDWLAQADFQSIRFEGVGRTTEPSGIGNCLLDMAAMKRTGLSFEPAMSLLGGEDTLLFRQMFAKGEFAAYSEHAIAYETVLPERGNFDWQMTRWRRVGGTDAKIKYYLHGQWPGAFRACLDGLVRMSIGGGLAALHLVINRGQLGRNVAIWLRTYQRGRGMLDFAFGKVHAEYARK